MTFQCPFTPAIFLGKPLTIQLYNSGKSDSALSKEAPRKKQQCKAIGTVGLSWPSADSPPDFIIFMCVCIAFFVNWSHSTLVDTQKSLYEKVQYNDPPIIWKYLVLFLIILSSFCHNFSFFCCIRKLIIISVFNKSRLSDN